MTDLDKEEKIARRNLDNLTRHIRNQWSFKRIKTFGDLLDSMGYGKDHIKNVLHYREDELNEILTFARLKEYLEDLRISQETKYWLKRNPPQPDPDYDTRTNKTTVVQRSDTGINDISVSDKEIQHVLTDESESNYGLPISPKEKCKLFWFQKKFSKQVLDNILIHHKHGQLLIAQAGHGKTFIAGAVLRRLLDIKFHIDKTMSPIPYMYVTKASVVEQTTRDLEQEFGIDVTNECLVTNYDQLRASLGKIWIREKIDVRGGIEYIEYNWRSIVAPCLFIIDECQSVKNEDSIQTKIITAIAEIDNPNIYVIFMSATPFTRVVEGKALVVNTRMEYHLI